MQPLTGLIQTVYYLALYRLIHDFVIDTGVLSDPGKVLSLYLLGTYYTRCLTVPYFYPPGGWCVLSPRRAVAAYNLIIGLTINDVFLKALISSYFGCANARPRTTHTLALACHSVCETAI